MALTRRAHKCIRQHFDGQTKGLAVDATCGNGYDTEFLCQQGFEHVMGFDIQERAIKATRYRLNTAGFENFSLYQLNHTQIEQSVARLGATQTIACAMFNFGYLPHGDKQLTTQADSSVAAINQVLTRLDENGLISLMCYPGHEQGTIETLAIEEFLASLPKNLETTRARSETDSEFGPRLYFVQRSV